MNTNEKITIIGGGPVGSLFSIYLSMNGYEAEVFEKREDPRKVKHTEGRSINLALSHRGIRALKEVGLDEEIKKKAVPMKGRMIHDEKGKQTFQPYGEKHQMIYSVERKKLNEALIDKAEKSGKVKFYFQSICSSADPDSGKISVEKNNATSFINTEVLFAADGAFSNVRNSFSGFADFVAETEKLSHSYKELHMNPDKKGSYKMEPYALHIWPREKFMLIALPNIDGSFTCTLFLPEEGQNSFKEIKDRKDVIAFFGKYFPDVISLMPDLPDNYFSHPESSLHTLHCFPWHYNKTLLIGDAAHAITPFYGQGMNAGFEDCRILNEIIKNKNGDWKSIFKEFESVRKPNAEAIAELALRNFIEMRDLVADEKFLLRKKIEARIHERNPSWLPLYSMVTFTDIPYRDALLKGQEQDSLMEKIMKIPAIEKKWETEEVWEEIEKILKSELHL
jgi:kynurenine 3-monooxygenase